MTYNVFGGTLNLAQSQSPHINMHEVSDVSVSLAVSCDSNVSSNSGNIRRRKSRRRTTATKEFEQFRTKQFARDQVHVKVVRENEPYEIVNSEVWSEQWIDGVGDGGHVCNNEDGRRAVEQNVDERSGDQHDGRHGGVGRG